MIRQTIAVLLCSMLPAAGCATAGPRLAAAPGAGPPDSTRAVLAEFVQRLPPGARVRVERRASPSLKGTLLKATDRLIVVQTHTRLPEPPIDVPLDDVVRVTLDAPNGTARAIGLGIASGAGAALGVFLLLLAIFAD